MKKRGIIIVSLWLLGAAIIYCSTDSVPGVIKAGKTSSQIQEEINNANKKSQSAKQEKKQLQSEIAEMEKDKKDSVSYIKGLDTKLENLSNKIEQNESDIQKINGEIKNLKAEKKKIKREQKKQYDIMKSRIKYMYENGGNSYVELLFSSESLSELFNRTEYISKVEKYDNNLLDNYQKIHNRLVSTEKNLNDKKTEIVSVKSHLQVEKDSVQLLSDKKSEELKKCQNLIDDKTKKLDSTEAMLASQEQELENLMAAQRKAALAEAAKKAAIEKKKEEEKKEEQKSNDSQSSTSVEKTPEATKAPEAVASTGYTWPLAVSGRISSYFGYRESPTAGASTYHKGIDIAVPVGTSVLATNSGTVITASYSSSAGNYICISHGNGVFSYYMHCSSLKVSAGTSVNKGQVIASSGNSGISTGPHLHFAIYSGSGYVNPLSLVSR